MRCDARLRSVARQRGQCPAGRPGGGAPSHRAAVGSVEITVRENSRFNDDKHSRHEDGWDLKTASNKFVIDSSWGKNAFRSWM